MLIGIPPAQGLAMQTRARQDIVNDLLDELPIEELREREHFQMSRDPVPTAELQRLSNTYNCMGLAFGSRRVGIDCLYVNKILVEDDYRQIPIEELSVGDLVLYAPKNSTIFSHVGIVLVVPRPGDTITAEYAIRVLSKFGRCGEYCHPIRSVPAFVGEPRSYWTQRKKGYR